ncbi:Ig-like domain-containing protein [Natronomonas sp. EA1]|uniref:Ig-like domain-containing protein n=1 Tax=Natronomonas sp. EA1 TaxID=3421655 RepID=UPI003EBBFF68
MDFRDDRGVSELLGAILLFGLLISLLIIVQATAVPSANEQVEFQHSQQVQGDMLQLADDIDSVAGSGSNQLSVIDMGLYYPNRFLLFNPPPVSGTLSTSEDATFTITNAQATGEVGDYWDGTARSFSSQAITYRSSYNVYQGAPDVRYASGTVLNVFENGNANVVGGDSIVDGNRINLVAIQGSRDVSQATPLSLDVVPLSAPSRTVTVADTGSPITVTITTELSAAQWEAILEDELSANGGNVQSVAAGAQPNTVDITLVPGKSYQLRLAAVAVGSGISPPDASYLTPVTDQTIELARIEATELTVEVRDQFNNPVANEKVSFSSSGGTFDTGTVTTDANGQATVTFTPSSTGTAFATATINSGGSAAERAVFTVGVSEATTESIGDEWINSGYNSGVLLSEVDAANNKKSATLTFENTGSTAREAVSARLISSGSGVESVEFEGVDLPVGGSYISLPSTYTVPSGGSEDAQVDLTLIGAENSQTPELTLAVRYDNGDVSRYVFKIEDDSNLLSDADRVGIRSVSTVGSGNSGMAVEFVVTSDPRTVTDITIEGTSVGADTVQFSGQEVDESSGTGGFNGVMDVGTTYALSPTISLTDGETVTIRDFRVGGSPVDLSGESVVFTLEFADGSERTYTVTLP